MKVEQGRKTQWAIIFIRSAILVFLLWRFGKPYRFIHDFYCQWGRKKSPYLLTLGLMRPSWYFFWSKKRNNAQVYSFKVNIVCLCITGVLFWYVCAGHVRLPLNFEQCSSKDQLFNSVKKGKMFIHKPAILHTYIHTFIHTYIHKYP